MISTLTDSLNYYQQLIENSRLSRGEREKIFIFSDVHWQDYQMLSTSLGDKISVLLKYSQGTLQIMSPSSRHEFYKENIGILLEAYFQEKKIRFYSLGSTTFRSEALKRGIEPDKSYCLHSRKEYPDLAIEVVLTSGGINSLEIYRALGVGEVWFWQNSQLTVYSLVKNEYEPVKESRILPHLHLALLANYVSWEEPFDAVLEFRQRIGQEQG